jgi:signal transduction histidine kinase
MPAQIVASFRSSHLGQVATTPRERLSALGWCAAAVVLALSVSGWSRGHSWLTFAVPLAAGTASMAVPRIAARAVPLGLITLGFYGYVIARAYAFNSWPTSYGLLLHVGNYSMQYYLVLPEAYALMAVGCWLLWRTTDRDSRLARLLLGPLVSPAGCSQPWSLLLLPVVAAAAELLTPNSWFGHGRGIAWTLALMLGTLLLIRLAPAYAADLAAIGLVCLGLAGLYIAKNWVNALTFQFPMDQFDNILYGGVSIASKSLVYLACAQGLAFIGCGLWLAPRTIGAHAKALLVSAPDAELARRVERLTESRAVAVDTAAAELRRLERDLHDGAQARLVELGMSLRAAERLIPDSPQAALVLVAEARQTSARALSELRDLVRGIYPPVLADRGLGDAVRALAIDTTIRTETEIDLPGRMPTPVESACYFAVAEILTNAVKHSEARHVQIRIEHSGGMLRIEVSDDGAGGADPARGTGLAGVETRLAAFDGILAISSPSGGPTMVVIEVPCALSSPKISSC